MEDFSTKYKVEVSADRALKIGIFGGTFDPIHVGHIQGAEFCADECDLDKVIVIPAATPNFKQLQHIASPADRLRMTQLAVSDANNPRLIVSDIEIARGGVTYTWQTLARLTEEFPQGTQFYFIMGTDSLRTINAWDNSKRLISLTNFICVNRKDAPLSEEERAELSKICDDKVKFLEFTPTEISSTEIRSLLKNNDKRSRKFLSPGVADYIARKNLYML